MTGARAEPAEMLMNRLVILAIGLGLVASGAAAPAYAAPIPDRSASGTCLDSQRSPSILVEPITPQVPCTETTATVGTGCDMLSTKCPSWVSNHDIERANDVPAGDVVGLSPDGSTAYVAASVGDIGARLIAVDASSGEERWASVCCTPTAGWAQADHVVVSRDGSMVFVAGWIQDADDPSRTCTGFVQAFDSSSGDLLWRARQRSSERCWVPTDITTTTAGTIFVSSVTRFIDGRLFGRIHRMSPTSGKRRVVYRTRVYTEASGKTATVENLRVTPDGRHLIATGTFAEIPPGDEYFDATGWFLRRLRITDHALDPEWSLTRGKEWARTNPLAGLTLVGRRRVIITGTTLGPFRAFSMGVDALTGRRLWTRRERDNTQSWPHAPLAARSGKVFLSFLAWSQGVSIDDTNEMVALDSDTGKKLWIDSFRSVNQTTTTSYSWDHFPMAFAHRSSPHLYQVLRGYGYVEVRALDPSTGMQQWYSSYGDGYRSLPVDAAITPGSGALFVGVSNVPEQNGPGRTQLLRLDP